jgi:hypothetical protein
MRSHAWCEVLIKELIPDQEILQGSVLCSQQPGTGPIAMKFNQDYLSVLLTA